MPLSVPLSKFLHHPLQTINILKFYLFSSYAVEEQYAEINEPEYFCMEKLSKYNQYC